MPRKVLVGLITLVIFLTGALGIKFTILAPKIDPGVLRVAFPYAKPARDYEPTKIQLGPQYIFLENIFSPLVEISPSDAEIEGGIAKSYSWNKNDLHLIIRDDLKTGGGHVITADDVVFSLKRLIILSGNAHGNFQDLVCPNTKLKKVEDECPGLKKEGNTVILKAGDRKTFLLPMLAAIDFAIVPRGAVDPKGDEGH